MYPTQTIKNQNIQPDATIPPITLPTLSSASKARFLSNNPIQTSASPNPAQTHVIKNELKIVIVGNADSSKSAAISTISDIAVKNSGNDLYATKALIEYGVAHIANNKLHLYCTPWQRHLDFMTDILCKGAAGMVIMIDNNQGDLLNQIDYYLHQHGKFLEKNAGIFAIPYDDDSHLSECQTYIQEHGYSCPVMPFDAREKIGTQKVLMRLLYEISNKNNKKAELVA